MVTQRTPTGLSAGGRALWRDITSAHELLDPQQLVQLTEACRAKDRLDKLDSLLRGDVDTWAEVYIDGGGTPVSLRIDGALSKANETANLLKQLLAAMRLPDVAGVRPQQRGGARGSYGAQTPGGKPSGKVSSIERARQRKMS